MSEWTAAYWLIVVISWTPYWLPALVTAWALHVTGRHLYRLRADRQAAIAHYRAINAATAAADQGAINAGATRLQDAIRALDETSHGHTTEEDPR